MTQICLGTWAWGNKLIWGYSPEKDDPALKETFLTAIEGGIQIVDTADSYGTGALTGRSEELLGDFIKNLPNDQQSSLTVATKLAPFPWRLGRKGFQKAFSASKERLQGHLHRVQLHWSTSRYAPWQEAQLLEGLGDLYENGSIKEIGLSNIGPNRLKWMHQLLKKREIPIKSIQIQMSLLSPNIEARTNMYKICKELEIELLAYSPLALGILAIPPGESIIPQTFIRKNLFKNLVPKTKEIRQALYDISNDHKTSQVQVALNWCRSHGASPIVGLRNPKQAKDAARSIKWELNNEEKILLDNLSNECSGLMPINPFISD